jgi:hypothetical protein
MSAAGVKVDEVQYRFSEQLLWYLRGCKFVRNLRKARIYQLLLVMSPVCNEYWLTKKAEGQSSMQNRVDCVSGKAE